MPNNVKTYDKSDDPKDHLKNFQAAVKVECWVMPIWCDMFNSTLTGFARVWFDDLPSDFIDNYDDLKKAFLANYLQQKKCIKDPVESHHIKQRERESTKDFVQRFKAESRHVKGAPKCMRKVAASQTSNQAQKKTLPAWKQQEVGRKQIFNKMGDFRNQQRSEWRRDKFTLLTKSPKEILALDKEKFKAPPPMTTPVEKRNNNKFCEFHGEVGHNIDECMHLKRQIKELIKNGKLSHQRVARQKITQSFSISLEISFPPLGDEDGAEGPMMIEAEIGGHFIHRIYVDGGSASEILYEHCFNRLCSEVKNQMVPATAPLISFSGEIIWPMGQILLPVKIGDAEHFTSTWMNFVIVISLSLYNGIIGRPGVRKIQAVPSTAHGMLKFPVHRGILTLQSSKIIPLEYTMVSEPEAQPFGIIQAAEERIKVAIHQEYPEQTIAIGSTLTEAGRKALCDLLRRSLDVFSWKRADMTGVPRHIAEHKLNVREGCSPVRQKKRSQALERNTTIQEEVEKLLDTDTMKEVQYHSWLSNPRLVDKAFQKKIGRNLEVFVDDLVIKSCMKNEIIRDMDETFKTLREINMKLNLKKCTFRIEEGMFLGYKVNTEGIMVCPDKVGAVLSLPSPKCLKDVQKLNGKLASLNRFLSKSAEKSLPFFKTLKKCTKKSDFQWTAEAKAAFKEMKKLIAELPTLTAPMEKEELIVYLAAARESLHASKRIKRYFQAHTIIVITDQPIKQVLSRPEVAGRLQKWSIELGEYDIKYRPRTSVKGKILVDFIVELPEDDPLDTPMEAKEELPDPWTLFTDGSSYVDGSGAGMILTNSEGEEFTYALRFRFDATNNEAEYEALIAGLRIAEQMGVKNLQTNVDSSLVANQVNGSYIAKEPHMIQYLEKVKTLYSSFKKISIKQVPRSENKKADALSKFASTSFTHLTKQVLVEELKEKSINEAEVLAVVEEDGDTWMTLIYNYLTEETLLAEKEKTRAVRRKSGRYAVINGVLYKKSYLGPWLRCVRPLQENYILREIHEGSCSMHAGTKSMVEKAIRTRYYWPTMHADAKKMIREYIVHNDEALEINLDLLEERREQAAIREARSKAKMEKYYNSKVRNTSFKPGDLMYRNNDVSHAEDSGKVSPKWERPYEVTEALGNRAYKLRDRSGKLLLRTWNVRNLKKCYVHEM
ncbi:reverse transcriptase domain-containing protein [Tanacetum coccineum]